MNTQYEHAGNADQLRELQFDKSARCELCHYAQGYKMLGSDTVVTLEPVKLPVSDTTRLGLLCQFCVQLSKDLHGDYIKAASLMRPLPPESQEANRVLLAYMLEELEGVIAEDKKEL